MTRINTNTPSLVARNRLQSSNKDLQTSLTRLSTGLRINKGSDDPAGLIASEALRSEITGLNKAVSNTNRAGQIIATADSGLGQVSSLLNDVRGLVVEAANSGALSPDEVAANQLQVDSSLEAINRIAQTTTFQGRKLLDGSMGFNVIEGTDTGRLKNLKIDQAALGNSGSIDVNIDISAAATQASVDLTNIPAIIEEESATADVVFNDGTNDATLTVTSSVPGTASNGLAVDVAEDTTLAANSFAVAADETGVHITVNGTVNLADIQAAVDGLDGYSAALDDPNSVADFDIATGTSDTATDGTFAGGVDGGGGLDQASVFQVRGADGAEVFSFDAGSSIDQIADAINLVSDSTGVSASIDGTTLNLKSNEYGSKSYVDVRIIDEADGGNIRNAVGEQELSYGTDVVANVNGVKATGDGNKLSINTSTLDLSTSVEAGFEGISSFSIDGGGALFQLGGQVVANQQARIGIDSVNTSQLGGVTGKLFELASGGTAELAKDPSKASKIVDEAIDQVTGLRGRLGAFQRTTIDSNMASLNDTVANLQEAESSIRDADFAAESARLTRAQILTQSGTSVLAIANQNPQSVLSLLG